MHGTASACQTGRHVYRCSIASVRKNKAQGRKKLGGGTVVDNLVYYVNLGQPFLKNNFVLAKN